MTLGSFKKHVIGALLLAFCLVGLQSVNAQQYKQIEEEVTKTLLKSDVGELAENAKREPASNFAGLVRQVIIFSRAGQPRRAQIAARKLLDVSDFEQHKDAALGIFAMYLGAGDFEGWKIYHEQTGYCIESETQSLTTFVDLWERKGTPEEIESWLATLYEKAPDRSRENCFRALFAWQEKRGKGHVLRERMRTEVEANPADLERAERYLRYASSGQDIEWLAKVFASPKAFDNYWLAQEIFQKSRWELAIKQEQKQVALGAAARLLERSLKQPFDEKHDIAAIGKWIMSRVASPPVIQNYEKHLRFWTTEKLAEVYLVSGQAQLAQPIAEELTKIDKSDLYDWSAAHLAGAVQAVSGMRAVESKILQEEATRSDSAAYWYKRIIYYRGRKEPELIWQTFLAALAALPFKPRETKINEQRSWIVNEYVRYLKDEVCENEREGCREATGFLESEFAAAAADAAYQHKILKLAGNHDEKLDKRWFAADPDLLIRILTAESDWEYDNFIWQVAKNEKIPAAKKQQLWQRLEAIANGESVNQRFHLAEEMLRIGEHDRAFRLLLDCLKRVPADDDEANEDKFDFSRSEVNNALFQAHLQTGNWREAEKLLFAENFVYWEHLPGEIEKIAVLAANKNAIADAVRLWKVRANLDRRQIEGLAEMAKTGAKTPLREFYLEMKRRDAETTAPDLALQKLQ